MPAPAVLRVAPSIIAWPAAGYSSGHPARDALGLTRREHEVLTLVCAGHTNADIARKLFISAKTVSAVLGKLGAPTREAATVRAASLALDGAAEIWGMPQEIWVTAPHPMERPAALRSRYSYCSASRRRPS